MFDARMLRIEVAAVKGTKNAEKDITSIRKTAKALLKLGSLPEIVAKSKELETLADGAFWENAQVEDIEPLRVAVRMLVPYLKDEKVAVVNLTIADKVSILPSFGKVEDIRTYSERVIDESVEVA